MFSWFYHWLTCGLWSCHSKMVTCDFVVYTCEGCGRCRVYYD